MKRLLLFSVFVVFFLDLTAQNTYVPDDNFEQALIDLGYDDTLDNYVLTANIEGVMSLYINSLGITDLTGIEDFTDLEVLSCVNNQLTSLDLSQNTALTALSCTDNQLTSLDVSQNTALNNLVCYNNQLTSLDVSQNTDLTKLRCQGNQLMQLDLSNNPNLTELYASNANLSCIEGATMEQVEDNNWISNNPGVLFNENCSSPDVSTQERNALIAFYNATDGTNWTDHTNWNTSASVTEWHGVTTEEINGFLRVTEINLPNNNLTGNLPDLVDLPELQGLYLSNNDITGGVTLSNDHLQELHLNNTSISSLQLTSGLVSNVNNGQLNLRDTPSLVCVTVPSSYLNTMYNLPLQNFDYGLIISDNCSNPAPVDPAEKTVFYDIYNVTNGENWNIDYGDMYSDLNTNNTGFTYVETNGFRYAIAMNLHSFGLNGEMPAALGDFTQLQSLDLSNNNGLTLLPSELGSLTSLTELRFNNCSIEVVPITIENLTNLTYLQFNNNDITLLPEQIGELVSLETLVASPNPFPSIPVEIGNLTNLEYLDLSGSLITNIPVAIAGLDNLTELYLDDNEIELIPENSIGNLITLTNLRLHSNNITELPEDIGNLTDLTQLTLNHNKLTTLPTGIGSLVNLTQLTLQNNLLETLPESFGNLNLLTHLDFSGGNNLTNLPESFGDLSSLIELDLYGTQLESLPESFGDLSALTELDLSNQSYYESGEGTVYTLTALPTSFNNLTTLTSLNLSRTGIEGVIDLSNLVNLSSSLQISNNKISGLKIGYAYSSASISANNNPNLSCIEVPTAYLADWQNANLGTQYIDNGVIFSDDCAGSAIPQSERDALIAIYNAYHNPDYESTSYWQYWDPDLDGLSNVGSWQGVTTDYINGQKHVVELNFPNSNQNLEAAMPEELGDLLKLTKLNLTGAYNSNTQIASLPESIGNLQELEELNITYTDIEELPEGFGNLSALTELSIRTNSQLTALSADFGDLSSLIDLKLGNNQLESLPPSFEDLYDTLVTLNASDNNIQGELPFDFNTFTLLTELDVSYNSIEGYLNLGNLELLTTLEIQNNIFSGLKLAVSPTALQGNCGSGNSCYFNAKNNNMFCIEVPNDELVSWQLANTNVDDCVIFSDNCGAEVSEDSELPVVSAYETRTLYLGEDGTVSLDPEDLNYQSTDNCSIGQFTADITEFSCDDIGEHEVTLSVHDISGNTTTATNPTLVTIVDNQGPEVTVEEELSLPLGEDGTVSITVEDVYINATDNCGIDETIEMTLSQTTFDCSDAGENQIYLQVHDVNGNYTNEYVTVTVLESEAPVAIAQDFTLELGSNGSATLQASQIDNGSSDNCGIDEMSIDVFEFDCDSLGEHEVTLTVSDASGNMATDTAIVTVVDNQVSSVITQDVSLTLDATGSASIVVEDIDNGSSDACGIDIMSLDITEFDCTHVGENEVTLTVTDIHGNTSTNTAVVTVSEDEAPVAITQDITLQIGENGTVALSADAIDNGSTDNCGIDEMSVDVTEFDCSHIGENEVMFTVTDGSGNTATQTATVTIVDDENPIATPQNLTLTLNENNIINLTAAEVDNGSTDNCSIDSMSIDITEFDCSNLGENEVTLTVTDNSGNIATQTATITVIEEELPVVLTQDLSLILEENGTVALSAVEVDNGSSDNCGIDSMSIDITEFDCSTLGENEVTLTVTDNSGNIATQTATITVIEEELPVAITQDLILPLNENGTASITPSEIDNGSTDNCGIATSTLDIITFDCSDIGENEVTLTITDESGNEDSATATVTVTETTPPTVVTQSISVELDENGTASITPFEIDNGSTDNCGIATSTLDITTFDCSDIGDNVVIFSVTDTSGNISTESLTVTVIDNIAPTVEIQNIEVDLAGENAITILPEEVDNGSYDNCELTFTLSQNTFTEVGEYQVDFTATDSTGNTTTVTVTITVVDTLGVEDTKREVLNVYPVPAKSYLNFTIASHDRVNSVKIYDLHGRKIKQVNPPHKTINLQGLQSGVYLFKFHMQKTTLTKQIIIE